MFRDDLRVLGVVELSVMMIISFARSQSFRDLIPESDSEGFYFSGLGGLGGGTERRI